MKKIKKIYVKLSIITVICIISAMLILLFAPEEKKQSNLSKVNEEMQENIEKNGELSDVAGYGYLLEMGSAGTKDLGQKIGDAIFVILIPGFFMFIVFVCQLVTGLIQIGKDKESKNFTSKILTIISLVQLSLLCMLLFLDLNSTCETSKLCIFIALLLSALCLGMHIRTLCKIKSLKKEKLNQTAKA